MYISSVTLIFEISRSKVKLLESDFNLLMNRILSVFFRTMVLSLFLLILNSSHPVLTAGLIVILRGGVGMLLGRLINIWLLLALLLIFLGGIIVIIVYVATLARADKIVLPQVSFYHLVLLISFIGFLFFNNSIILPVTSLSRTIGSFYSITSSSVLVFLTAYLLIGLLSIVKLSEAHKGAVISWT